MSTTSTASKFVALLLLLLPFTQLHAQGTETMFLSGTDKDHTKKWKFYCTAGRNSGKWTTIAVPSNWELQGFGKYNYGHDKDTARGKEKGLYKYQFNVPATWKGKTVNIVFDGSMTDTEVKINGQSAGRCTKARTTASNTTSPSCCNTAKPTCSKPPYPSIPPTNR
ncbi:sugar-binding domain-containing protein [Hymenobacter volaticus]|uniref:beta-galactosidase n=1 Tax=Hymenobacter volaticus TaxID=2932254 RepID=A0ABY4GAP6_9BACT|nr:sugar-binding domain-containing protein [Hymenobacter volaticus]UOQ67971.1 hypothetical protein MUN86_08990 [Hymenobacter volaticus]